MIGSVPLADPAGIVSNVPGRAVRSVTRPLPSAPATTSDRTCRFRVVTERKERFGLA